MSYIVKKSQDGKQAIIGKVINTDIIKNIKNSAYENDIYCCIVPSIENIPRDILNKCNVMTNIQFIELDVDHRYIRNTDKFDIENIEFNDENIQLNGVIIPKGEKIINISFVASDISNDICTFLRLADDKKKRLFPVQDYRMIQQFVNENNTIYNNRKFAGLITGLEILAGLKLLSNLTGT